MDLREKLYKSEYDHLHELVKQPDWYLRFGKFKQVRALAIGAVQAAQGGSITERYQQAKTQLVDIFETLLLEQAIRLGQPGENLVNLDEDRLPVSQIAIHHSSRAEGITTSKLNALHLLRLYLPEYQNKSEIFQNDDGSYQPLHSGHFDANGSQVFYGYHWRVNQDGSYERLLDDSALGWHAGDYEVNRRSVGICIDDDLTNKQPSEEAIEGVVGIITRDYPDITITDRSLIGHRAVFPTECPGHLFETAWKSTLLRRLG